MKLTHAQQLSAYRFILTFADRQVIESDLRDLIGEYVNEHELTTAQVDMAWSCLTFLNGQVDIAPETLARYVGLAQIQDAA
ncbi:hypothetical protein HUU61_00290 [Rhodopseudomonas palustris]|uniref:Uncharacterized protein n=1 Tax=Thiospirillum jenense TaxID=1653858 RepID=A0A839HC07_9GAMM|nr:hypothetical protein [Thiospirillum jenense]MBB1089717.1 hypothetical protein [Rhodopseudomonas palustris]MBB1124818.1 hypothetical protein [Thiospirillum jenense]